MRGGILVQAPSKYKNKDRIWYHESFLDIKINTDLTDASCRTKEMYLLSLPTLDRMKALIVSLKFSNFLQLQEEQSLVTGMPHALLPFKRSLLIQEAQMVCELEAMFYKCLVIAALFQS